MLKPESIFAFPNKPIRFYDVQGFISSLKEEDWISQPKWDGHRAEIVCDEAGKITVFSRNKTRLALAKNNWGWLNMLDIPRPWLLDAELLRDGRMITWDYAMINGQYGTIRPYLERLTKLEKMVPKKLTHGDHSIEVIETLPLNGYRKFLLKAGDPALEGFVLKNKMATDLWGPNSTKEVASQFKYRFK